MIAESPIGPVPTGYGVAGLNVPVQHADLVAGRQDVGEHQDLLVVRARRKPVGGGVGEGHPHVLGLRAVDQVTEDPATPAGALAVAALATEATCPTGRDARHEHPVATRERLHPGTDRLNRADRLVAEDPTGGDLGGVALQDVQVRPADRRRVDADNRVGVGFGLRVWDVLPVLLTGSVVDECLHRKPPRVRPSTGSILCLGRVPGKGRTT